MERPVVASAHGGVLDLLEHGVNGLLFPPGDVVALADCLSRSAELPPSDRHRLIAGGFTLPAMVTANLAVYRTVLGYRDGTAVADA